MLPLSSPEPRFKPELLQMEPLFGQWFVIQYKTEPHLGSSFRQSQIDDGPIQTSLNRSELIIGVAGVLLLFLFCDFSEAHTSVSLPVNRHWCNHHQHYHHQCNLSEWILTSHSGLMQNINEG